MTPSKLDNPIDTKEIKEAITKLNLNKATGPDQIQAELLKATQDTVAPQLAEIFNNCFEKEVDVDLNINLGNLLLIQKPGKPKGPIANLRPIVLLSTFRKILSLVTLGRIRNKIENYLSASQAGFRPNRSTTDIVFAHKILIARIKKYQESFTILGIDLSSAFDTIHRDKLLDILKDIVDRDELTLIRFLLANTKLNLTCGNKSTELTTIIGTPQGDSLSPILFVVYLEAALRELRPKLPTSTRFEPSELIYADDCDLIFDTPIEAKQSVPIIVETLGNWNLKVNASKTEFTTINRNTLEWQKTRKLGSLLDDQEDLKRRKQLATVAFKNLQAVWVRKNRIIKEDKILSLYNSLVLPILTYNCSTWSLTKQQTLHLDSFHRKQLRRLLGIYWPNTISNQDLYTKCNCRPISESLPKKRSQLLGHILRRPQNIPAKQALYKYFDKNNSQKYRGRPPTTIVNTINEDLSSATSTIYPYSEHSYCKNNKLSLNNSEDLEKVKDAATDRESWRKMVKRMS